jgi:cyanophycin synthetase
MMRWVQYAAGNVFDKHPVALLDASLIDQNRRWTERLTPAWAMACEILQQTPSPSGHPCTVLNDDAELALVVAHLACELRRACGLEPGRVIHLRGEGKQHVAGVAARERDCCMAAIRAAATLLLQPQALSSIRKDLDILRYHAWLTRGTWASAVATRLGIPWRLVATTPNPFVALGEGHHRRLFWRHMVGTSGALGTKLSEDKRLSSQLLRRAGLPAPLQREVKDVTEARKAAEAIGWPVVIKPADSGGGKGVTAGIEDSDTLNEAFHLAKIHGPVIVEKHIPGHHHRINVIRGKFASALRFDPAHVVGDGRKTIAELLEATNNNRKQQTTLYEIKLDDNARAMLKRQGLSLYDVPKEGKTVVLRSQSNISSGGTFSVVTDSIHIDNKRLAETAAKLFDIEICGVDFITPDASRSWLEIGGGINEVNRNPAYIFGYDEGKAADMIIGGWFPEPSRGRLPVVAIIQSRPTADGEAIAYRIASTMHQDHSTVAVVTSQRVVFGEVSSKGAGMLSDQVEAAMCDPSATALVVCADPQEIFQRGLGLDRLDVLVVADGLKGPDVEIVRAIARLAESVVIPASAVSFFSGEYDDLRCRVVNTHSLEVWVEAVEDLISQQAFGKKDG